MNRFKYVPATLLLLACNEPVVETQPEPEQFLPQCEAFCEKIIDVCGYDPPGAELGATADDCPRNCTERSQEEDCGDEKLAWIECTTAKSCEDLRSEYEQGQLPPKEQDACRALNDAFSVCDIVHHSPAGGG